MLISIGIKIHSKVALKLWCCFWCIFTWNCVSVKHNPSLLNKFTLLIISSECFHNDLMFSNVKATLSLLVCRINDKLSLYYIPYSFLTFWFNFMGFRWYFPTRCMFSNFDILINGTYIWLWFKFLYLWSSKLTKTLFKLSPWTLCIVPAQDKTNANQSFWWKDVVICVTRNDDSYFWIGTQCSCWAILSHLIVTSPPSSSLNFTGYSSCTMFMCYTHDFKDHSIN